MVPEYDIPNSFFETLEIDTTAEWITARTGISARRTVLKPETITALRYDHTSIQALHEEEKLPTLATMGVSAWENLNERFPGEASVDTDVVICGTSVGDWEIPAAACPIAGTIGLKGTAFDTNSACSSFVVDLHVLRGLMAIGAHSRGAVFNVERYSSRLDYKDRASCILFGDGASVATVAASEEPIPGSLEVVDTVTHSDSSGFDLVGIPMYRMFRQQGSAVQKFAVSRTVEVTKEIMERNELDPENVDYFIGHQANLRMLKSSIAKLGVAEHKHLYNVDTRGNQGGAGAPGVLSQNWEKYKPGDHIIVAVVGSGLTWAAALLKKH